MNTLLAFLCWGLMQANTGPAIKPIANQFTQVDQPAIVILEVSDDQTQVQDLQFTLATDNPNLVLVEDYVFNWFFVDNHRYLCIAGAFGQSGVAHNIVTVSDGQFTASTDFLLTVFPTMTKSTARFAYESTVIIPDVGVASQYPIEIPVAGMQGRLDTLEVTISRFNHEYPADVNILLVNPTGFGVVLLSRAGGGEAVINVTFSVADDALFPFDPKFPIWPEIFLPTDYDPEDAFPAPAPDGPYGVMLSDFNGVSPNGVWTLYIYDSAAPDHGQISGCSLLLTTIP